MNWQILLQYERTYFWLRLTMQWREEKGSEPEKMKTKKKENNEMCKLI